MEQLALLWELQETDLAAGRVEEEMEHSPLKQEAEEMRGDLASLQEKLQACRKDMEETRKRIKSGELDLQKVSGDAAVLQKKLYGGEISNVKELEQMEKKLSSLQREKASLEDTVLSLMEQLEASEEDTASLEREVSAKEQQLREKEAALQSALDKLQEELSVLQRRREELASRIQPQYLERYRLLAQRHHGRGIARVLGDTCEGCRVFISAAHRGLLYKPGAMVYCENCGRLLFKQEQDKPAGS